MRWGTIQRKGRAYQRILTVRLYILCTFVGVVDVVVVMVVAVVVCIFASLSLLRPALIAGLGIMNLTHLHLFLLVKISNLQTMRPDAQLTHKYAGRPNKPP